MGLHCPDVSFGLGGYFPAVTVGVTTSIPIYLPLWGNELDPRMPMHYLLREDLVSSSPPVGASLRSCWVVGRIYSYSFQR